MGGASKIPIPPQLVTQTCSFTTKEKETQSTCVENTWSTEKPEKRGTEQKEDKIVFSKRGPAHGKNNQ